MAEPHAELGSGFGHAAGQSGEAGAGLRCRPPGHGHGPQLPAGLREPREGASQPGTVLGLPSRGREPLSAPGVRPAPSQPGPLARRPGLGEAAPGGGGRLLCRLPPGIWLPRPPQAVPAAPPSPWQLSAVVPVEETESILPLPSLPLLPTLPLGPSPSSPLQPSHPPLAGWQSIPGTSVCRCLPLQHGRRPEAVGMGSAAAEARPGSGGVGLPAALTASASSPLAFSS